MLFMLLISVHAGQNEGQTELRNALSNQVVYCANISYNYSAVSLTHASQRQSAR